MNDKLLERCQLLISNRDAIRDAFIWNYSAMHLGAALIYTLRGLHVDADRLKDCYQLVKQRVGAFNNFRSHGQLALAAMMDVTGDPTVMLDRALQVYDELKTLFFTSTYLPMAAMTIAQHTPTSHYNEIVTATHQLYERIRRKHPFLTGSEDCAYCTLMAISGLDQDALIENIEACYALIKGSFFSSDAVQSLSHTLALYPGKPEDKVTRTMNFYHDLKALGRKWGTGYELSMLGVVALTNEDQQAVIQQVMEADAWLARQRGFGFWSSMSSAQRLMYAGILTNAAMSDDSGTNVASMTLNSTIAVILAQQAAMSAVIASSSAHH